MREQQCGAWGDSQLGFADFLIESWRFIFRPGNGGVNRDGGA
jgi:hypothetical protein